LNGPHSIVVAECNRDLRPQAILKAPLSSIRASGFADDSGESIMQLPFLFGNGSPL
jgi:hypothetical protein